jgi:hypothetical protein
MDEWFLTMRRQIARLERLAEVAGSSVASRCRRVSSRESWRLLLQAISQEEGRTEYPASLDSGGIRFITRKTDPGSPFKPLLKAKHMKALRTLAIASGLVAVSLTVSAAPYAVDAGMTYTVNIDLGASGATPAPTYTELWIGTGIVKATLFDDGQYDSGKATIYGGLNGTGSVISAGVLQDTMYFNAWRDTDPEFVDGDFSIVYEAYYGSFSVDTLPMWGCKKVGPCEEMLSDFVPITFPDEGGQVPEPATFALLGIGLAAAGFGRRKTFAELS